MSKKNKNLIPKKPVKISKKKSKIVLQDDDSFSSEDFPDFEKEELQEKNKTEKEIKGEVERIEIDDTKIDNIVDKTQDQKKTSPLKVTKKQATIDSILDAYEKLNIPELEKRSPQALKGEKLNILTRILGDLTNKMATEIVAPAPPKETGISDDLATQSLYNVNLMMVQFLETLTDAGRQNEMTKDYVPNLKGMTENLLKPDKAKVLKETLKAIIQEHGAEIKPYLSPVSIWLMLMIGTATETIANNASKNSSEAIISSSVPISV